MKTLNVSGIFQIYNDAADNTLSAFIINAGGQLNFSNESSVSRYVSERSKF